MNEFSSYSDILYEFDKKTKEFIRIFKASLDPVSSELNNVKTYFRTINSTFKEPPEVKRNETPIFENDEWKIKKYYFDINGKKIISDEIPDDAILESPPSEFINPKYENNKWIETGCVYHNKIVKTKKEVDSITSYLIFCCGENKAKTEKIIAGNNKCEIWEIFLKEREKLIKEGNDFIIKYNLK